MTKGRREAGAAADPWIRAGGDIDIIRKGGVELVRAVCLGPYDTVTRELSPTRPSWAIAHASSANRCQRWSKPLTECSP